MVEDSSKSSLFVRRHLVWPELISILALAVMVAVTLIVLMCPYRTNGSLVLTAAKGVDRPAFFRRLLSNAAFVTIAAPVAMRLLLSSSGSSAI